MCPGYIFTVKVVYLSFFKGFCACCEYFFCLSSSCCPGPRADKGSIVQQEQFSLKEKEKQREGGYISVAGFSPPLASAFITMMRCRCRVGSGTPDQRRHFGKKRRLIGLRAPCSREQLGLSAEDGGTL